MCSIAEEATTNADAVVLVTEWTEYLRLPWSSLKKRMRQPIVID